MEKDKLYSNNIPNMEVNFSEITMKDVSPSTDILDFELNPSGECDTNIAYINHINKNDDEMKELMLLLSFLDKKGLKNTHQALMNELKFGKQSVYEDILINPVGSITDKVLASYRDGTDKYINYFQSFKQFISNSQELYRFELSQLLYPIFIHLYIFLVQAENIQAAKSFYLIHFQSLDEVYQNDLKKLAGVTQNNHLLQSTYVRSLMENKFTVKISTQCEILLFKFLHSDNLNTIANTLKRYVHFETYDGAPRNKHDTMKYSGALMGEIFVPINKNKILHSVYPDPDLIQLLENEFANEADKKKKQKIAQTINNFKKSKQTHSTNLPPLNRIPITKKPDREIKAKDQICKTWQYQILISSDSLPCICFYTLLNTKRIINCININEDVTLISAGCNDSTIRIYSLTKNKLQILKFPNIISDLPQLDTLEIKISQLVNISTATDFKLLIGHKGPIYSTNFSSDSSLLLSCSEDGTIRLWSLHTFTTLVCFSGHNFPVWDVQFSPLGFYFVSTSNDCTGRIWNIDQIQPLRILAEHYGDVDLCKFHPNGNYIATGSSDRTIRVWDIMNGKCVRIFTGHKGTIHSLAFNYEGKILASSASDCSIILWDLITGLYLVELKGHTGVVYSLAFSRDDNIMASGGQDMCIKLWNVRLIMNSSESERSKLNYLIKSYSLKSISVFYLSFSYSNVLIGSGHYID